MEKISNSTTALMKAAETEIENFGLKPGEKIIAYFSRIPSLGGFPYKIILAENSDGTIRSAFRQWDSAYDFSRWTLEIYNLDRLRIITDEKMLADTDAAILKEELSRLDQIQLPESIQKEKAIVLDGSEWKFGVSMPGKNVDYTWRASTEDIDLFVPIIELMRKQYSEHARI